MGKQTPAENRAIVPLHRQYRPQAGNWHTLREWEDSFAKLCRDQN